MNDPKKLAEAINKRPKEFAIHLIAEDKIDFLLNYCTNMIKWLDLMYCLFKYNQANDEWIREIQILNELDIKTDPESWLKQLEVTGRKQKKVDHWENKHKKLADAMS